ncbi:unnamed protein product [Cochlearia groenlandica]
MSSSSKTSSASPSSASGLVRRSAGRSARPSAEPVQDNPRLSPSVGSTTDRSSDLVSRVMSNVPTSATGGSVGRIWIDVPSLRDEPMVPPPKRVKVSAKNTSAPTAAKKKTKEVKPVHIFTSSKCKLASGLGKITTLSATGGELLELLFPEPN